MENLEDKFVAGEWIPPFIEPSPAPKKKKGNKQNKAQPYSVTVPMQKRKPVKKAKKVRTLLINYPVCNFDL